MLGEVQYYHMGMYFWNTVEEWRERERWRLKRVSVVKGEIESVEDVCKCKQSEPYTGSSSGGEMEVHESELPEVAQFLVPGLVRFLEPEPCTDGQDKYESVTVGVTFLEKVGPCFLADPYVVSGWVITELGAV